MTAVARYCVMNGVSPWSGVNVTRMSLDVGINVDLHVGV
jgi:hypothetical protein